MALGHDFADPRLLATALTHRSAAHLRAPNDPERAGLSNERLEFLGDRVLGLVVAEWLAERFPDEREGALARRLADLVARPTLARLATEAGLERALSVAPGEARAGVGRQATVLADAMEALIGALYLDGGLEVARRFVRARWADAMAAQIAPPKDPKTALQEFLQTRGRDLPLYRVSARSGPSHAPDFTVTVEAGALSGIGSGGTKRAAERAAAADLLGRLA